MDALELLNWLEQQCDLHPMRDTKRKDCDQCMWLVRRRLEEDAQV